MGCVASHCVWLKEKASLDTIPYQSDEINEGRKKTKENEPAVTLKSFRTLFEEGDECSPVEKPYEDDLLNVNMHDPLGSTDDEILSEDVLIHHSSKIFSSYSLSETSLNGSLIPFRGSCLDARISRSEDEIGIDEVDETRAEEVGTEVVGEEESGNKVVHEEGVEAEENEEEEELNITYNVFENEGYLHYLDFSELKVIGQKMSIHQKAEEEDG